MPSTDIRDSVVQRSTIINVEGMGKEQVELINKKLDKLLKTLNIPDVYVVLRIGPQNIPHIRRYTCILEEIDISQTNNWTIGDVIDQYILCHSSRIESNFLAPWQEVKDLIKNSTNISYFVQYNKKMLKLSLDETIDKYLVDTIIDGKKEKLLDIIVEAQDVRGVVQVREVEHNIWLMTDPVAYARYEFEGKLDKLEFDIKYEVLRGQPWSELDYQYLEEINRLLKKGYIKKLASYWAVSPHPTIYRALTDGNMFIGGKAYPFRKGQEITWACPMTRDMLDLDGPALIGNFSSEPRITKLCGEMPTAMKGRMGMGQM